MKIYVKRKSKPEKEVSAMITAVKLQEEENALTLKLAAYLERLKEQERESREQAILDAKAALKRTGVTDNNGKTKEKIVTWE